MLRTAGCVNTLVLIPPEAIEHENEWIAESGILDVQSDWATRA